MNLGDKLNGSALKYITLSSPAAANAGGSTDVFNASGFEWGTLIITCGSAAIATNTYALTRSATSNGTFATFGASIAITDGSKKTLVRSFKMDNSATFLRAQFDMTGATSATYSAILMLAGARVFPVTQDVKTTVFSDVIGG